MITGHSRRAILAAMAGASGTAMASSLVGAEEDDICGEIETLEAEISQLESELAELEALVETIPERNEALYEEIITLHQQQLGPTYDDAIHTRAESIAENVRESIVILDVAIDDFVEAYATAWSVDDGYLLTNAHNVDESPEEISCMAIDGQRYEASVVDAVADETPDVALLETNFDGEPLPTGSSDGLTGGDYTIQVGHPGDFGYWVVSLGEFITHENENQLQTTNPGLEGNSGSPIFDDEGLVVAMTYAGTGDIPPVEPHDDEPRTGLVAPHEDTAAVPIETVLATMEVWR